MSVQKWHVRFRMQAIVPLQQQRHANNWIESLSLAEPGLWWACGHPCNLYRVGQLVEGSPLVLHHIVHAKVR